MNLRKQSIRGSLPTIPSLPSRRIGTALPYPPRKGRPPLGCALALLVAALRMTVYRARHRHRDGALRGAERLLLAFRRMLSTLLDLPRSRPGKTAACDALGRIAVLTAHELEQLQAGAFERGWGALQNLDAWCQGQREHVPMGLPPLRRPVRHDAPPV